MPKRLTVCAGALSAVDAIARSRDALDAALPSDAVLTVAAITSEATVIGAFQRSHGIRQDGPRLRRISGGPFVTVGPGTLHVLLQLAHPAALIACDASRLVNRYVRPLLRALTKSGAPTHYFGRDWISTAHRPVGQVGFAHDSLSGRAVFEAFVAVSHPFALAGRASFLSKEPGTLESVVGRAYDADVLGARIGEAYAAEADEVRTETLVPDEARVADRWYDPPWAATADEAIGQVAAGRDAEGTLRLGGDLLASRDVLGRVASAVAALPSDASLEAIGALVDRELLAPGVALDGVRDLAHVREVLAKAR